MAYLKPPAFTRHLANPLAMRLSARGVATLTVVGRRTGDPQKCRSFLSQSARAAIWCPRMVSLTGSAISELPAQAS
jgi:hypothetical protein